MDTVFGKGKECFVCGNTYQLNSHHIFCSTADRPVSERLGLKVWLCYHHHSEVHAFPNQGLDLNLKQMAQAYYEEHYGSRDDFRHDFRKSYL